MQQRSHRLRTTLVAFAALLLASSLCQAQFNTNSKTTTARPAPSYTPPPPPPRPEPAPRPTYNPPAERPAPAPSYNPAPRPAPSPSPAPSYTPAPRPAPAPNTYTPAARPAPATNTYTPAARPAPATTNTYTPRPAGGAAPATEAPRTGGATTYAPRTYTPGSPASNAARPAPTSNGATTYTPHTYTPSTSAAPARETSQPVVHTSNGVTTYTPHASGAPASSSTGGASSYSVRSPAVSGSAGASAGSSFNGAAARPVTNTPAAARPIYSVAGGSVAVKSTTGAATLTTVGSHQVIQQLNAGRSEMSGINKRAIPPGKATVEPNGHVGIVVAPGRSFDLRPNGSLASLKRPGLTASFRGDGHIAVLRTPALEVAHGPHGERLIVARRPDHTVVVSTGPHAGYVQRTVTRNGVSYIQRTYATRQYGPHAAFVEYRYHGVALDHYVPRYTYAPAFYGWAYYGWDRPTPYAWGWDGQPWLGYYGGYFSPTQAYLSGALWLTDFYLGQTLAAGYQQENADAAPDDGQGYDSEEAQADDPYAPADTPITPEVKQAIADEVQQQLAYENAAAAQPDQAPNLTDLPQVLQPNHIFVVDEPRSVLTADQQTCSLSAGNVIQLAAAPGSDDAAATLTVVSSRRADCPAGVQVTIALDDLQEMQNNFRAQLDAGLKTLHDQQGQGGLPAAPLSAISPPPRPGPDLPDDGTDVQAALTAAQRQASQAELNVAQTAFAPQP